MSSSPKAPGSATESQGSKMPKLVFALIGIPAICAILLVGRTVILNQGTEKVRRQIAVAGGKSELIPRVPAWVSSIAGEKLNAFFGETTIIKVNMNGEKFGDAQMASLVDAKTIEVLDLESSQVTNAGLASVSQLKELKNLNLSQTKVTDLSELAALPKLEFLNIGFSQVRDAGLSSVSGFPALKHLNAGGNSVSDAGVAEIGKCTGLETLSIRGCTLSPGSLKALHGLKALKELNLIESKFDSADAAALQGALPGCTIHQ